MGRENQDGQGKQKKQKKSAEQKEREAKARAAREAAKASARIRRRKISMDAVANRKAAKIRRVKARAARLGILLNRDCPVRSYRNRTRKLRVKE